MALAKQKESELELLESWRPHAEVGSGDLTCAIQHRRNTRERDEARQSEAVTVHSGSRADGQVALRGAGSQPGSRDARYARYCVRRS